MYGTRAGGAIGAQEIKRDIESEGRFGELRFLGEGGMSWVFRTQVGSGEAVAIKIPKPSAQVERFRLEGMVGKKMGLHPNIVTVLDLGRTRGGVHYIVMEYVPLPTLAMVRGQLPERAVLEIARGVCRALSHAYRHARIRAHRDIKPGNIFVDFRKGRVLAVKLSDFGVVKTDHSLTMPLDAIGVPDYISPEELADRPLGPYSDIFSLGVVMFEFSTGQSPWSGSGLNQIIRDRISRNHTPRFQPSQVNRQVSPRFNTLTMNCLQTEIRRRIQTTEHLLREIDGIIGPAPEPAPKPRRRTRLPRTRQPSGGRRFKAIAASVLLIALLIANAVVVRAYFVGDILIRPGDLWVWLGIWMLGNILVFSSACVLLLLSLRRGVARPAAARARRRKITAPPPAALSFVGGGFSGRVYRIDQPFVSVGRNPGLPLSLPADDLMASRLHANIVHTPEGYVIENRGRNGTLVNGRQVSRHLLREGDQIQMGYSVLRFSAGAAPGDTPRGPRHFPGPGHAGPPVTARWQ